MSYPVYHYACRFALRFEYVSPSIVFDRSRIGRVSFYRCDYRCGIGFSDSWSRRGDHGLVGTSGVVRENPCRSRGWQCCRSRIFWIRMTVQNGSRPCGRVNCRRGRRALQIRRCDVSNPIFRVFYSQVCRLFIRRKRFRSWNDGDFLTGVDAHSFVHQFGCPESHAIARHGRFVF